MKSIAVIAVLLAAGTTARSSLAQQPTTAGQPTTTQRVDSVLKRSGIASAVDSVARKSSPELQQAFDQLAATLNALRRRIETDPELRASALRAAQGLVGVAQVVIVEQTTLLQDVLRVAAERIAAIQPPTTAPPRHR